MSSEKTRKLVLYALFIAIIILMAFTPLGYLKTLGLEITFITIPVVIGAVALGPLGGAVLGAVFGITSFIQCFGLSPFGAALLAVSPVGCLVTCIVPRTLMGWLTGLVFRGMDKIKPKSFLSFGVTSLFGPVCNTVLFMTSLMLFFGNAELIADMRAGAPLFAFLAAFVGINGLVEALVCFVVCTAVCKALSRYLFRQKKEPETEIEPEPDMSERADKLTGPEKEDPEQRAGNEKY